QLVGLVEGDTRTFTLTFPDDYPDQSLQGREVEFEVEVRELRQKRLPDADDDFAQSLGSYADLSALRAEVGRRLEGNARDKARHDFAERIIEFAVANATVAIPELLIDREVEVMQDELRVRLAEQGIGEAQYLEAIGKDADQLTGEYREPAAHRVKTLLVLSAVADAEGIDVPDADVEAELARARTRYTDSPKLISYFETQRGRSYLRSTLRRTRTVETLVDRWLEAHPEFGDIRHLEDHADASATMSTVSSQTPVMEGSRP
ncbi:MAG: hypothetical protein H0V12_08210, partial [Chloroflexi bacterium]|nr:hypothetical protein [Chloroflexota bacterium]